ncbi:NnrS family protein [Erythrobacter sp.]|uniref:NnrS family protein n=1 Tax=Erythrobacter sp. TaxID=1042 RepID=UPI00311F9DC7
MKPSLLLAAPHRIPFLTGSLAFGGLLLWWLAQLAALHSGLSGIPATDMPPTLLHGPSMIYLGLAPFIFGFLLTVFPRWIGLPDLALREFVPVSVPLLIGTVSVLVALATGSDRLLSTGYGLVALGWTFALPVLLRVLWGGSKAGKPACWHAWSALAGLSFGLLGLLSTIVFLGCGSPEYLVYANRIGIGGFLLPIFLTIAHRMVPFFAGNVVEGYVRWRPDWLILALWTLLLARLTGELLDVGLLAIVANGGLAAVTGVMVWRWWPRSSAPGLLNALIWGFAWGPVGFALTALDAATLVLGRGPDHALLIGFAGSLLVAMVTRVTQGHSGRPLAMPMAAWLAFAAVQAAVAARLWAAIELEWGTALLLSVGVLVLGMMPWLLRNIGIYLSPRKDGKAG